MTDIRPMGFAPIEPQLENKPAALGMASTRHTLPISFTGSGSEYFRIWMMGSLQQKNRDATGDAAGDFLNMDIGL